MNVPPDYATKIPMRPPNGREAAYRFAEFNPEQHLRQDGTLVPGWEAANIVRMTLPRALAYVEPGVSITVAAIHKKVAPYLKEALEDILASGNWHLLSPYGGGFHFRMTRGSYSVSMHGIGLALDFDPPRNPYHVRKEDSNFWNAPGGDYVLRAMETRGFFWGGRFINNPDAMHFQFATGV
jgi:hypothetical protein